MCNKILETVEDYLDALPDEHLQLERHNQEWQQRTDVDPVTRSILDKELEKAEPDV